MSDDRFGELFGELRSLLNEGASDAGVEAVAGALSGLRREGPERFEAEVLPYASAMLERWYAGVTHPLQYALRGRVALAGLQADVSWLRVVRALDLRDEQKTGAAIDALVRCTQLTRLEALATPDKLSGGGLRRLAQAQGLGGLKQLLATEAPRGTHDRPLDVLLSGPMGASLELLEIQGVGVADAATRASCPRLAQVKLEGMTHEAVVWLLGQELPALRTLKLGAMPATAQAEVLARLGEGLLKLDVLSLQLRRGTLQDAALSAPLWRAASALGLESLSLHTPMLPMSARAVVLMRDTIEHLPRLKNLYISPGLLSPEAEAVLRGSRAGALLKV